MDSHMKTTVHIPDALLAAAQAIAAREKTTLKALINEGLQKVVKERRKKKPFRLEDGSVCGRGLSPELEGASWEKIRELAYEGRGG
jgi:hypothetical protein